MRYSQPKCIQMPFQRKFSTCIKIKILTTIINVDEIVLYFPRTYNVYCKPMGKLNVFARRDLLFIRYFAKISLERRFDDCVDRKPRAIHV